MHRKMHFICILKRVDTLLNENRGEMFHNILRDRRKTQSHKVLLCKMYCCKMRKVLVIHLFKSCSSYLTLQFPFFYNSVLKLVYCVEVDSVRSSKTDDKLRFASIFTPKADGRRWRGGGGQCIKWKAVHVVWNYKSRLYDLQKEACRHNVQV
jgi:hypothetical protein